MIGIGVGVIVVLAIIIIGAFNTSKGGEDFTNTFIKIGLGVAIAVVFPLMVGLGIEAFYPSPTPSESCQTLKQRDFGKEGPTSVEQTEMDKCNKDFESEMQTYNRNVFVPITIIGFVALAGGALFLSQALGPVSPGLVFGGIITILYGAIRGFSAVDKRWLFLELVVLLIGLVLVTMRYLRVVAKESK